MKILLIPSAALIPLEMQMKMGKIPSALYPYNNGTILDSIYNRYKTFLDKIFVSAYYNSGAIQDYVKIKQLDIEVIVLNSFGDLGDTICECINKISSYIDDITEFYINFGDTCISNTPPPHQWK